MLSGRARRHRTLSVAILRRPLSLAPEGVTARPVSESPYPVRRPAARTADPLIHLESAHSPRIRGWLAGHPIPPLGA